MPTVQDRQLLTAAQCVVFNYHRDNLSSDDVAVLAEAIAELDPDWTERKEAIFLGIDPRHAFDDGMECDECVEHGE